MGLLNTNLGFNVNKNENVNVNKDRHYYYEKFPRENIPLLKAKLEGLVGKKRDFEQINAERRTEALKTWIESIERLQSEIQTLLNGPCKGAEFASEVESQLKATEELEKQASELDEDLEKQGLKESILPSISETLRNNSQDHPTSRLIGIECNLDKIIKCIRRTECAVIGIWGACGIGKTAVLREIGKIVQNNDENQKFSFTKVILLDITKTLDIEKIQNKFAEHLELVGEYEQNFSKLDLDGRARKLAEALANEKFLIMLDDVWTEVNFRQIGIPRLGKNSESKIVYTTRLRDICQSLNPDVTLVMQPLSPSDSRKLFEEHSTIKDEKNVDNFLRKCTGIPLALIRVALGTSARGQDKIYRCLNNSPTEIKGMKENVLDVLKPSFDSLKDATTKRCFLFCVLFQDSNDIDRNTLKDYWMGEGLVRDGGLEVLRETADDIVEQLLGCCLLEKTCDDTHVKIHNIVRSTAVWLAKEGAEKEYQFQFYAGGDDFSQNDVEKMKGVKRASFVDNETDLKKLLKQFPCCADLVTLLMSLHESRWISHREAPECSSFTDESRRKSHYEEPICSSIYEFLRKGKIPKCRVLDLAHQPISRLPTKFLCICIPETLRYLNLSYTSIAGIPSTLGMLRELILLDLTATKHLIDIPRKAISSLRNLNSLKLADSIYRRLNRNGQLNLEDLKELPGLVELQLPLRNLDTLKCLSKCTWLSERTTYLQLELDSLGSTMFQNLKKFVKLRVLSLISLDSQDEIIFDFHHSPNLETLILRKQRKTSKFSFISPAILRRLHISECGKLTSISCLCLLQNLEKLEIEDCEEIVELLPNPLETSAITGNEGAISPECEHQDHTQCLGKLKLLKLDVLPKLERVSHCNLPFKCLEAVSVENCPKLKKLHVNHCTERKKIKMSCKKEWWEQLDWENGLTSPSSFLVPF